jgi:uncharacterized protein involved in response to NO
VFIVMQIEERSARPRFALFELGFRPFFSMAGIFAVFGMLVWMLIYLFSVSWPLAGLDPVTWHAHEMIYGYAMAVVAGFLLTAVSNWTGIRTWHGVPLAVLLACWFVARAAWMLPYAGSLPLAATADMLFMLGLVIGVSLPVIRARQWKQLGIVSKLGLMVLANGLFYAGALGLMEQGIYWGLYLGLYLLLGLIFVMARRVLPFFIERGVKEDFKLRERQWLDVASLVLFFSWAVIDILTHQSSSLLAWLSLGLAALHVQRLIDWHTPGIWQQPLLWSLYLAYAFLVSGFLLKAFSIWLGLSPYPSLHAFTVGGIGLMTVGMMSRVTLGHTGRNVFEPPRVVAFLFAAVVLAMFARVVLPLIDGGHYILWIGISQVAWIAGFAMFSMLYVPYLVRPRIDGRPG